MFPVQTVSDDIQLTCTNILYTNTININSKISSVKLKLIHLKCITFIREKTSLTAIVYGAVRSHTDRSRCHV